MAAAYATPGVSQILDLAGKNTAFPEASASLMFHWLLWGHMSHPEPIIVFWAVRLGLAGCGHVAVLISLVRSALQEPHGLRVGER